MPHTIHVAPPGGWGHDDINPDKWADNMLRNWKVAAYHKGIKLEKKSISLNDVDSAEPGELVNTPRSLQACLYLGIDPSEIQKRDKDYFVERGLSKELQELKYQYHEKERKEKLGRLLEERNKIVKEHNTGSAFVQDGKVFQRGGEAKKAMTTAMAKADERAEVLRRRQEKDAEKKAKFEAMKAEMLAAAQRRVEAEKKKVAAQKAEKLRKDKEFQAGMRARELQRLKEEEELEKLARKMAEERYKHEMDMARQNAIKARKAKKLAILKEQERAAKQEEFRQQLEKIQEDIIKEAIEKQKEMLAKDAARKKIRDQMNKERAEMNAATQAAAEERHEAALQSWLRLLQKRKDDYEAKCAAERVRRKEKMMLYKRAQADKKAAEEQKEAERLATIQHAIDIREQRCQKIKAQAEEKDRLLREYVKNKALNEARTNTEKNLQASAQHWRCQQTQRKQALHRRQVLDKIEQETAKVRQLLDGRVSVQKRRQAMQAKQMRDQLYGSE